jgi:hypothetical protein
MKWFKWEWINKIKSFNLLKNLKQLDIVQTLMIVLIVALLLLALILLRSAVTPTHDAGLPRNVKIELYRTDIETISKWISPDGKVICFIYNHVQYGNNSMDCFAGPDLNFIQFDN